MDFAAIRQAIAARLQTIDGLTVYPGAQDVISPPCAWPILRPPVNLNVTLGDGEADITYQIFVAVGMNDTSNAQDELDTYLTTGTAMSIIDAVEADSTLGGTVEAANFSALSAYETRTSEEGAARYLVAILDLDCYVHQ